MIDCSPREKLCRCLIFTVSTIPAWRKSTPEWVKITAACYQDAGCGSKKQRPHRASGALGQACQDRSAMLALEDDVEMPQPTVRDVLAQDVLAQLFWRRAL
ncbi:hypothetical protein RF11_08183 [Thelohanellus kitauei]|uniref:Uncharacterized protein n=1 Tax=Thelohanellus kitauei TaxID=669202 RepID=A0A0C2JWI5_THEKT|nr:hypothetical protein RF11_08183 [Thelohanellus kitauei]